MTQAVVVGAGVVGLTCAVRLAKEGARVTLLEAESEEVGIFGPAASPAAAGMLAPLEETASPHDQLALDSLALWRRWREGAQWSDGVRFEGGVVVARDGEAFARKARGLNRQAQLLSPKQFAQRTGFQARLENAVFVEDEAVADPIRVLSGLAMQARAHGVLVKHRRDVCSIANNVVMTFEGEACEADAVVLAPGAWATRALKQAAPALERVRPAKGHLAAVSLPRPLGPNLRTPGFYIAQRLEEAVLGSTMEFDRSDRRVSAARVDELHGAAALLLPGEVGRTGRAWAGVRPMSPDGWPIIGPAGADLFVAAGHSRNGWLLAPITAEIICAYVFGREIPAAWAALSPERFNTP